MIDGPHMITLIAAIGRNNELGIRNGMPWKNIPEDLRHFKSYTMGKMLVMGYKTYQAIGKPLPGRRSIVVTHRELPISEDLVIPAHSLEDALSLKEHYAELVVIGGGTIYNQTIDTADKLVITHIDADFEADVFFPKIDLSVWKINSVVESYDKNYDYKIVEYVRNENLGNIDGKISGVELDHGSSLQSPKQSIDNEDQAR
jgi:dihydrofolate reductase